MFRYFYRIWDKFRYKYEDYSDLVGAAIYIYKGEVGKDKNYVYKLPDIKEDVLVYNFRTIDIESIELNNINDENPLKLVFKMAKKLLEIGVKDEDIFQTKIELFNELVQYEKVKTIKQRTALVYFLEYLFLIQDDKLEANFKKEVRDKMGGVIGMSIDEIREMYLKKEGREEGDLKRARIGIKKNVEKWYQQERYFRNAWGKYGVNRTC